MKSRFGVQFFNTIFKNPDIYIITKIMQVNFIPYFTMSTSLSETAVTFCSPFLANFITYKFKKSLKFRTWLFSHTLKFQYFQIPSLVTTCPHTWPEPVLPANQNSKFDNQTLKFTHPLGNVLTPLHKHFNGSKVRNAYRLFVFYENQNKRNQLRNFCWISNVIFTICSSYVQD